MAELQWFITEQVEEEKTVREIVAKFHMVKNDPASLLDLDRELGARTSAETAEKRNRRAAPGESGPLFRAVPDEASASVRKRSKTPSRPATASSSTMRAGVAMRRSTPPLAADGHVHGDELAEPRAVDVVDVRQVEEHVPRAA